MLLNPSLNSAFRCAAEKQSLWSALETRPGAGAKFWKSPANQQLSLLLTHSGIPGHFRLGLPASGRCTWPACLQPPQTPNAAGGGRSLACILGATQECSGC